ncbi:phosphoesterase [Paraburkholderia monticola]|uniref:Phosphoesterase n=2 Tax=Paraburkholderia monticola TaxID=1399968 RepID=A0A149PGG6_9BURK|nr:phosphoesterase [Paraburkholderia monticola]
MLLPDLTRLLCRVLKVSVVSMSTLLIACGNHEGLSAGAEDVAASAQPPIQRPAATQVAFMPDIHFHDVYATFKDGSFQGVPNRKSGKNATIRLMQAQMTSTRLFNENYFAFIAALDDAVGRGVRFIALPGDFSDDGQPVHIRGLQKVLDDYSNRYGIEFFAAPGNHDPNRPFARPGGKDDYLGVDPDTGRTGAAQAIYSRGASVCDGYAGEWTKRGATYCTEEVQELGYDGITTALARHGFMPKANYLYYETPYSTYNYRSYSLARATEQASWKNRQYEICKEGAGGVDRKSDYTLCHNVPDTTYLVEPVEGVWLVGIDANVYIPGGTGPNDFAGSGDAGYNRMLTHKPHVIRWLTDVVARGKALNKQVVAFSHFPMSEFFNGASDDIIALLGAGKMQMVRRPEEDVTRALADTGLKVHVGGHMHFNDTAVRKYDAGHALFNIQAPSLAAYVPAYKLLTLKPDNQIEVQTVRLDDVPRFDELFEHYRDEHRFYTDFPAKVPGGGELWSASMLDATNYADFTSRYMSELVRLRLLKDDWRCEMRELVKSPLRGSDLLVLSQLRTRVTLKELQSTDSQGFYSKAFYECLDEAGGAGTPNTAFSLDYAAAEQEARALAHANGLRLEDFNDWRAIDLAGDFVRIANAGDLAFADIPESRARQYKLLHTALQSTHASLRMNVDKVTNDNSVGSVFQARFKPLMDILLRLANGAPTRHFVIDLTTNDLTDLTTEASPF